MSEIGTKERQRIVLAALLHDIGKFWERSDFKYDKSEFISKEFPNKEYNHTVPTYETGYPMYGHALWTQAFINQFDIGGHLKLNEGADVNLATLSARHHKPSNHLEGIISLADKWSSSIDRPDEGEEDESHYTQIKDKWGDQFHKKAPLESIFDVINKNEKRFESHTFGLFKLNVFDNDILFAKKDLINKNKTLQREYKELWNSFEKEVEALIIRCSDFDAFYISINDILRNYTWCISSATNVIPANVSLYEHLKTTAGIALCLYDYYKDTGTEITYTGDLQGTIRGKDALLMVCVDLSGIQKFIYDIASKKAAKSLKGRSFFLNLLMQHIVDKILSHDEIQAYPTNVIYASGGKAYLLLPNIDRVNDALKETEEKIQKYLWDEYQGRLYACIGKVAFNYETFKEAADRWTNKIGSTDLSNKERNQLGLDYSTSLDLGHLWRIVSDRASAKKGQKFKRFIVDNFDKVFIPIPYEGDTNKCDVTGERSKNLVNIGNDIHVLPNVEKQIVLGKSLKSGNYIISYKKNSDDLNSDLQIEDEYIEVKSNDYIKNRPSNLFGKVVATLLNNTNHNVSSKNVGVKTMFYGGNVQPEKANGEFKTFEDIAMTDAGKVTKLAILRMDVDNLGQIFIHGFDEKVQKKSFAAYATLSFLLEAFFCGYINHIHQRDKAFKDYVQILYSGGDDLFAVGRWDVIIDFAAEVRREFERFICRPDITISAGISIVGAKYPIMKSADLAGEAEKAAKEFNKKAKNAVNFFGETVSWGEEYDCVKGLKDRLMYSKETIGSAFLQNIQKYKLLKDNKLNSGKKDLSYVWHSAYTFKRLMERLDDKEPEAHTLVKTIADNILHNIKFGSDRYLDLSALAARWAEYLLKDKK